MKKKIEPQVRARRSVKKLLKSAKDAYKERKGKRPIPAFKKEQMGE